MQSYRAHWNLQMWNLRCCQYASLRAFRTPSPTLPVISSWTFLVISSLSDWLWPEESDVGISLHDAASFHSFESCRSVKPPYFDTLKSICTRYHGGRGIMHIYIYIYIFFIYLFFRINVYIHRFLHKFTVSEWKI